MQNRRHGRLSAGLLALLVGAAAWLVPASPARAAGTVTENPSALNFGNQRVGTFGDFETVTFTFTDNTTVSNVTQDGAFDFVPTSFDCLEGDGSPKTFTNGDTCKVSFVFFALDKGGRTGTLTLVSDATDSPHKVELSGTGTTGYYIAGAAGGVAGFGDAKDFGDMSDETLNDPVVGIATFPNGEGYWLGAEDGGVFAFGQAGFHGSMGGKRLNAPIVGIAASPDGEGYWLVASDGGVFAFGTAQFWGSMGGKPLNEPVVGIWPTPTGNGYWLVALDGGIFSFGDADFFGSMGGKPLNEPMVAMTGTPSGGGYHTVALDGGIFSFGDAEFFGSMGGKPLNLPMIGIAEYPTGQGYWTVAVDGGVFAFGDAPFHGSLGKVGVNDIMGIASTSPLVNLGPQSGSSSGRSRGVTVRQVPPQALKA